MLSLDPRGIQIRRRHPAFRTPLSRRHHRSPPLSLRSHEKTSGSPANMMTPTLARKPARVPRIKTRTFDIQTHLPRNDPATLIDHPIGRHNGGTEVGYDRPVRRNDAIDYLTIKTNFVLTAPGK